MSTKTFKIFSENATYRGHSITVIGMYSPPYRGKRDSMGAPVEPNEQEEIEIKSVEFDGINIFDMLNTEQFQEIEEIIWLKWAEERG